MLVVVVASKWIAIMDVIAVTAVKSGGLTFSFVLYIDILVTQPKQRRYVLEEAHTLLELLSSMFTVLGGGKKKKVFCFFCQRYFVLKMKTWLFTKPWQVCKWLKADIWA